MTEESPMPAAEPMTQEIINRLKELLAKATTPHDQSKMHGTDYDRAMLATFHEITRLLPTVISTLTNLTPSVERIIEEARELLNPVELVGDFDDDEDEMTPTYPLPSREAIATAHRLLADCIRALASKEDGRS